MKDSVWSNILSEYFNKISEREIKRRGRPKI